MSALSTTYYGLCTNCGEFDDLDSRSGFCDSCHFEVVHDCIECGRELSENYHRRRCQGCRYEAWLLRNADAIEYCIAKGFPFSIAKEIVRTSNRPKCRCCGAVIYLGTGGGERGAMFCKQNMECRRTRAHYFRLKRKGAEKALALKAALAEHKIRAIISEVAQT